jgi:hypothetical protein
MESIITPNSRTFLAATSNAFLPGNHSTNMLDHSDYKEWKDL